VGTVGAVRTYHHLPNSGTGVARSFSESAYPELWQGHVASLVPCLYGHARIIPPIGTLKQPATSGTIGLRQYDDGGGPTSRVDESPIGDGWDSAGTQEISCTDFASWCPWSATPNSPHTYIGFAKHNNTSIAYLFENNPKLLAGTKWRGEVIYFSASSGGEANLVWCMGDDSGTSSSSNRLDYSTSSTIGGTTLALQDNQWFCFGIAIKDTSLSGGTDDLIFVVDGVKYQYGGSGKVSITAPVYTAASSVRWSWGVNASNEDLSLALFQVFDYAMTQGELEERTLDPLKMFMPFRHKVRGKAPAATRVVSIGGAFDRTSRVAYAG